MKARDHLDKGVIKFLESQDLVTLGFSTGKDSLACALLLKELGVKFIPFFFYHIPDLHFVNQNLKKYEDFFKMEIIQLPHPMLYDYLRHQDFMPPKMIEELADYEFPVLSFEDMISAWLEDNNIDKDPYDIVGMRADESFNRRMIFRKQGFYNHEKKKVYPISLWRKKDVMTYITASGTSVTEDYKIWNRSFDGLKYQFLFGVKQHYPDDFQTIKEYFPLIELELFRYEQNKKYFKS